MIDAAFAAAEVIEVHSFAEACSAARGEGPFDLVFLDLIMPGISDPLAGLAQMRATVPDTPILVVSSQDDAATVDRVIAAGAAAFLSKSASRQEMEAAIRSVFAGEVYGYAPAEPLREPGEPLSPRQRTVLELLARGRSNRQIAADLSVEEITVKAHISAILRKLHVKSRLEAVVVSRSVLGRP
jgi:DNA-binding NarL/FixJ family response regulator